MDSLTQIVLGAAIGEKFLGKKIGNRALLYGAIAGTIPDLDVYAGRFFDPITANAIHRGFSHSILFFVLISPLLGWLLSKIERKNISFRTAVIFWFFGLFTHALLDAFTTWGTSLFYPLDYRVSLHSIFVIDPLYTLPFLFCLLMVLRYKRKNPKRQKWNNLGLIISSSYLLLTIIVQQIAKSKFDRQLKKENIEYSQIIVKPSPFNIILWNTVLESGDGYYIGDYSFFDTKPVTFDFYPKNKELLNGIEDEKVIGQLIWISEGWYQVSQKNGKLFFNDLRFGMINNDRQNPEFAFSYEIVKTPDSVQAFEIKNKTRGRGKELLRNLWNRLKGN